MGHKLLNINVIIQMNPNEAQTSNVTPSTPHIYTNKEIKI